MSAAAKSVYYFSFYLLLSGAALFFFPNFILSLLGLPVASDIWIHLVGVLTFILGIFFWYMGQREVRPFFFISLFGRGTFILGILALILLYDAPPALLLFAAADAIGLMWTWFAYRGDTIE